MFEVIKKYKREFVYSSYLFLVLELMVTKQFIYNYTFYAFTVVIGILLLIVWISTTYALFGKKKVSKRSDVFMKIQLIERFFQHIIIPILLYLSLSIFLFSNNNKYIDQISIVISVIIFFYLMLHIRMSLGKVYSVSKVTRVVYDFSSIAFFYFVISVVYRLGLGGIVGVITAFFVTLFSLVYSLIAIRKVYADTIFVAISVSFLIGVVAYLTKGFNIYIQPSILTVIFYTVISLWNVRFSGSRRFEEYIPPMMYSIMAIILILSL